MENTNLSIEEQIAKIASCNFSLTKEDINEINIAVNTIEKNYKTDFEVANSLYHINLFEHAPVFYGSDYWNEYVSKMNEIIKNFQLVVSCFNMKYKVYSFFDDNHNDDTKLQNIFSDDSPKSHEELVNSLHQLEDFILCVWEYVELYFKVVKIYNYNQKIEIHKLYGIINNFIYGFMHCCDIKCTINIEIPKDDATFDDLKHTHTQIDESLKIIKRFFYRDKSYRNNVEYLNNDNIISLPLILQKASVGLGKEATAEIDIADMTSFSTSDVPVGATHAIIIDGDSMEPEIHNGQIVFIKFGQQCDDGDYGIFAVTMNYMTEVYCRQYKYDKNSKPYLHSVNKTAGDLKFRKDDNCILSCVGKILGW